MPELMQLASPAMTYDEASMERSKSFVKALQELKNLRPQLYSAAEYCERSYLHSEQKQMVVDNLKDYAVRALVNAVDHLGTVAFKLTDLFEQQLSDVSDMELKVLSLNQRLLTCKTYTDKEGLKQLQLFAVIPRHHKHYILPNSVNKKVQFSPYMQTDVGQKHVMARPRFHPSGPPLSNTLSWHLASETTSTLNGNQQALIGDDLTRSPGTTAGVFRLLGIALAKAFYAEEAAASKLSAGRLLPISGSPASNLVLQTLCATRKQPSEGSRPMTPFRSFHNVVQRETPRMPARSKSVLSAFFPKQKTVTMKNK
ncbi:hypothetical protein Syun_013295 [Stephania yunnanensis]|uniref:Protein ABIL1 n=1 Tax=Stephania yunnanensis TaxID=152371 RepID=A0AAP0K386_9MAGN